MKWEPIETAPKDGRFILAIQAGWAMPSVVSWSTFHPNAEGKRCWRTNEGHKASGFTHWMPLPKSPKKSKSAAGESAE